MAACIRYEDWLEKISNYLQWKVRMLAILRENKFWNFVSSIVVVPTTNPIALDVHEVKEAKDQIQSW
jgi:hypothetical protein